MMNFLKNVVWVVVVLAVGIFILRMPAAAELRQLVLAEPAVVAPTSVPTPTPDGHQDAHADDDPHRHALCGAGVGGERVYYPKE
jgi:hypothetical protein